MKRITRIIIRITTKPQLRDFRVASRVSFGRAAAPIFSASVFAVEESEKIPGRKA